MISEVSKCGLTLTSNPLYETVFPDTTVPNAEHARAGPTCSKNFKSTISKLVRWDVVCRFVIYIYIYIYIERGGGDPIRCHNVPLRIFVIIATSLVSSFPTTANTTDSDGTGEAVQA